jgi:sec-independent protein translocase protein TatB
MELLGVGPGEILLILVIMLLVFGPERLPEFARQAGLFVVRVRDWIQRSPDAALVLRARAELESELQAIRAELTREVESVRQDLQSVRSDLADAGKLVEQSAQDAAAVSKIELPDAAAQSAEAPSIAPPAPEPERSRICPRYQFRNQQAPPCQSSMLIRVPSARAARVSPKSRKRGRLPRRRQRRQLPVVKRSRAARASNRLRNRRAS